MKAEVKYQTKDGGDFVITMAEAGTLEELASTVAQAMLLAGQEGTGPFVMRDGRLVPLNDVRGH